MTVGPPTPKVRHTDGQLSCLAVAGLCLSILRHINFFPAWVVLALILGAGRFASSQTRGSAWTKTGFNGAICGKTFPTREVMAGTLVREPVVQTILHDYPVLWIVMNSLVLYRRPAGASFVDAPRLPKPRDTRRQPLLVDNIY